MLAQQLVGVGLRHPHYKQAITETARIDFVEVHAENFFMDGGASLAVLDEVCERYPLSIHGTSMGLGSIQPAPLKALNSLKRLVDRYQPMLVSDHLCFTWSRLDGQDVHSGDLLPIAFDQETLDVATTNILRVQEILGRAILVENLSAYLSFDQSIYSETDFLNQLCDNTQCRLLVDLNNLAVNAHNLNQDALEYAGKWLAEISASDVGEIHLAGCTPVTKDQIMIDDHSQPVADKTWQLYRHALTLFGPKPTLIEWDTQIPDWSVLISEAAKAKALIENV